MKFNIEYTNSLEQRNLFYVSDEYAFDVEPSISEIDFDITVNKLKLTVIDGKVVQVWGFCPYDSWIKSAYDVPKYTQGILRVINDLEPGFSYRVNEHDWPVYVNTQTGWVCVGNPKGTGEAVEFMHNCIAVVSDNRLISLWLKPKRLPIQ